MRLPRVHQFVIALGVVLVAGLAVGQISGPRAGQSLILCAKARALLQGRVHAAVSDIRHVAAPVLRHRIVTTFHAEAEGIDSDRVVAHLLTAITAPPVCLSQRGPNIVQGAINSATCSPTAGACWKPWPEKPVA